MQKKKFVTQNMKLGDHGVIDDAIRAFFAIQSHHHIRASITFHHILHIYQSIVGALRYGSSFSMQKRSVT